MEELIKQHKDDKPLFKLKGDRLVIAEVPNKDNQMMYLIKNGDKYTLEDAWNQPIIEKY